jgi:hypothetical protein
MWMLSAVAGPATASMKAALSAQAIFRIITFPFRQDEASIAS